MYEYSPYPAHILNLCLVQPDVEFSYFLPLCFSPSLSENSHFRFILFYHVDYLWEERRLFFLLPAKRSPSGESQDKEQVDQVGGHYQRANY